MFTNTLITAATTACNTKRHSKHRMTVMTTAIMATVALASSMSYAQLLGVGNTTVNLTIPVSLTGLPSEVSRAFLECTFKNSAVTTTGNGFTGGGPATVVPTSVSSGQPIVNGVLLPPLTVSSAHAVQQNVVINAVFSGSKPDIATCTLTLTNGNSKISLYPKAHTKCMNPTTSAGGTSFPYMCVNEALGNTGGDWAFNAGAFSADQQIKISIPITY